jgi:ABC-type glycerol-3-phosphate transport system substrate-binding protein
MTTTTQQTIHQPGVDRPAARFARRRVVGGAAAAALVPAIGAALAGCTSGGAGAPPPKQLSGVVHVWAHANFPFHEDVGGEIARSLTTKYPNLTVQSEPISGNAYEKLTAAVAAGDPPEISNGEPSDVQTLGANGVVISLDDYFKRSREVKKDDIWPSIMVDVTYKGKPYGINYAPDLRVLYVSANSYRAAGLDANKPPATWDDLERAIGTVRRGGQGGDIEHLGFDPFLGSGGVYRWMVPYWQLGGELLNADETKVTINNEKAVQALTWLKKVIDAQGSYEKMQAFEKGTTYQQLFMDNKVAHLYATFAERAQVFQKQAPNLQYGFATYPLPPGGKRANYGSGWAFTVSKGAKNPDGAWAFLEHFMADENNLKFADRYDRIPMRASTTKSERYHRNDPFRKLAIEEMPGRKSVICVPGASEALPLEGTFVTNIVLGKTSIREGLQTAEQQIQQALDKFRR